jgi:mRNA interferase YafQ
MRDLIFKRQFSKDVERIKRTGRDMSRLAEGKPMPPINRDHALVGNFKDYRECHLGGDWLLLYQITGKTAVLVRTGSHADLLDL